MPEIRWSRMETFATYDLSDIAWEQDISKSFQKFGVIKVQNVFSHSESQHYLDIIRKISNLNDSSYEKAVNDPKYRFSLIGGISKTPDLWPVIWHPKLLEVLAKIYNPNPPKFYFDDKIGVNLPSYSLHTDAQLNSNYGDFVEFDRPEQVTMARVISYLKGPGRQSDRFGFIPFSHLNPIVEKEGTKITAYPEDEAIWVDMGPRDIIIFNPLLVHTGQRLQSAKYMMVMTYDQETAFSNETFFKIAVSRELSANCNINSDLKSRLKAQGLLFSQMENYDEMCEKYRAEVAQKTINRANQY